MNSSDTTAAQRAGTESPTTESDDESRAWLAGLRGERIERDDAVRRLHELLLRAARWQLRRYRSTLSDTSADDVETLAQQIADDATIAVLSRLDSYEGRSRFTTWAIKFAIFQTSVTLRRRTWRDREIPTDPQDWPYAPDRSPRPEQTAEGRELATALRVAIDDRLTPHQRTVLIALAVNGVPIDVLAERLGTSRGALYKTLHDARGRLRGALTDQGFTPPSVRGK